MQLQEMQEEQEEHMIQCEMMRWMVPRVPNLPPEPSERQIAEHVFLDMQCTEAGVVIALRRGVERTHTPREGGELPEIGVD